MNFSVLMAVYYKEDPKYFDKSLESVLVKQTIIPNELVLVKDGELNENLDNIISKYINLFPNIIKIIELKTNSGLGEALRIGLENCTYDYIARMDSDDICYYKRFEKQIKFMNENPEVDLVGSNIVEFVNEIDNTVSVRKVPTDLKDIIKMCKHRNPINHVTVFLKKSSVEKAGGYSGLKYVEDYYLWIRMINTGCNLMNIDEELVFVRVGEKMYERRSDIKILKSWIKLQNIMIKERLINIFDYSINIISMFIFVKTPSKLKRKIYERFLRKKVKR